MSNILVLGGNTYQSMFKGHDIWCLDTSSYYLTENAKEVVELPDLDLIVFCGGTDVDPRLYGEVPHHRTQPPHVQRDLNEMFLFKKFVGKVPMFGICRGAQFLNVMNGGNLVQHTGGHGIWLTHPLYNPKTDELLTTERGAIVEITSTHHQVMIPGPSGKLLAIAHELDNPDFMEAEIVEYPHNACLCVQGHPEYMPRDSTGYVYVASLLRSRYDVNV